MKVVKLTISIQKIFNSYSFHSNSSFINQLYICQISYGLNGFYSFAFVGSPPFFFLFSKIFKELTLLNMLVL